jgi:hypothetical protein
VKAVTAQIREDFCNLYLARILRTHRLIEQNIVFPFKIIGGWGKSGFGSYWICGKGRKRNERYNKGCNNTH